MDPTLFNGEKDSCIGVNPYQTPNFMGADYRNVNHPVTEKELDETVEASNNLHRTEYAMMGTSKPKDGSSTINSLGFYFAPLTVQEQHWVQRADRRFDQVYTRYDSKMNPTSAAGFPTMTASLPRAAYVPDVKGPFHYIPDPQMARVHGADYCDQAAYGLSLIHI